MAAQLTKLCHRSHAAADEKALIHAAYAFSAFYTCLFALQARLVRGEALRVQHGISYGVPKTNMEAHSV